MNEENNEEVVLNDVPETSEENLEEVNTDTSEGVEQNPAEAAMWFHQAKAVKEDI